MSTPADRLHDFGFLIKDIGRLFTKLFEYEADHLGITLSEAKVLSYLSRNPGLNQVQLAELTGVEPMSLVRILDRMEIDQWIERRAHPTDRRARQLHLQTAGQSTLDQIWKVGGQVRAKALVGFKAEERNLLIGLLARVHGQMLQMMAEQTDKTVPRGQTIELVGSRIGRKSATRSGRVVGRTARGKPGKESSGGPGKKTGKSTMKLPRVGR